MTCLATGLAVWHNSPVFHLGDVIRKLRNERGLNLVQLSKLAGVNKATISEIERGEANPRADTLTKIAVALGVTSAQMYAATVHPQPETRVAPPHDEVEMLERFRVLDVARRATLVRLAGDLRRAQEQEEDERGRSAGE
jgi:transcriptional regulator with XRE-family HTH domain